MSTKNIALDSQVYERLARYKRESESFSRAVDRLLSAAEGRHGGADILRGLRELSSLNEDDAAKMADIVERDRAEKWERHDLR